MPERSTHMAVGAPAVAPQGYVQFCERQLADCGVSDAELRQMRLTSTASSTAVAAIAFDWSKAFAEAKRQPNDAIRSSVNAPARPGATTYDWANAFAEARVQRASNVQMERAPGGGTSPQKAAAGVSAVLTSGMWGLLTKTNDTVNRAIAERSDQETYGVSEFWATPLAAGVTVGDCEDYVLEKRRALIRAGVPASALSIAVVSTDRGLTHAVLLVATDKGDYVLDNLSAWVLPWQKTAYRWRERQVDGSASQWAFAAGPATPQPAATPQLLLASLR